MPKITADIPQDLYKFLRNKIVDQRGTGKHITVSTVVTNLLRRWKIDRFEPVDIEYYETVEDEESESSGSDSSIVLPAIYVRSLPSNTTGGKVDRLIAYGRFSEEEEGEVEAAVIELINRFISFKETQRKMQRGN